LEALDTGKPHIQAKMQVLWSAGVLRNQASWADKVFGQTKSPDGPIFGYTRKEPIGVVGQIIPWNYPILMYVVKVAPALTAGCTIVLKPAEQTPLTALYVSALVKEAGFPPGVINVITGKF
jgi:acyl-CoA reductase-like NAD-dependent aldehyde dehydrogenase